MPGVVNANLKPDMFFVHVQKTGGTTLKTMLQQYHDLDRIAPGNLYGSLAKRQGVRPKFVVRTADVDEYTLFAEHTNYVEFVRDDLARTTMLREPGARLRSQLGEWQKIPREELEKHGIKPRVIDLRCSSQTMELGEFLEIDADLVRRNFVNGMTKTLVSNFPIALHVRLKEQDLLEEAIRNLERMDWVGLTERFDDSMVMLCDRFGWPVPESTQKLNVNPKRPAAAQSEDPRVEGAIEYDRAVYECGVEMFERAHGALVEQHGERLSEGDSLAGCVDDAVARRWSSQTTDRPVSVEGAMKRAIRGIGWHEREGIDAGRVYRWTGPSTRSTIECLIKPADSYRVTLEVVSVMDPSWLGSLRIRINGVDAEGVEVGRKWLRVNPMAPQQVSAVVRGAPVGDEGMCRVEIIMAGTKSHEEIKPGCGDRRMKGVAVGAYQIEPC